MKALTLLRLTLRSQERPTPGMQEDTIMEVRQGLKILILMEAAQSVREAQRQGNLTVTQSPQNQIIITLSRPSLSGQDTSKSISEPIT